ncbi:hypothetical protein HYH03_011347 [Edaphochlamys debaryana]|uniref:protein-tyrosine-phosphatase n=1 Tax=Edaphochlamys debaryana TaxID=47281 RepID=A0A835XV46_9CHLO|nr:hypothetical protein HYH03_011347 [Edaphochlamys debaryana]|eukprot:KAG2490222.1 hypothetical protein HYH03_011347 [Edaphochlamys debaryana]
MLDALGITHVLSVLNYPVAKDLSAYSTLQLPLQDSEDSNMLQYLPAAIKFLDGALGGAGPGQAAPGTEPEALEKVLEAPAGALPPVPAAAPGRARVLVHCQAGVSRSPTVVIGWLMHSRGLSADDATALVRRRRPCADPNEGFAAQLVLFGDMRCSLDPQHPVYRMWALEELGSRWESTGWLDPDAFGELPEGPAGMAAATAAGQTLYRCRKCRTLLATSAHVMPVEAAMGHRVFRDRNRHRRGGLPPSGGGSVEGGESCLFVAPVAWMAPTVTGVVTGKLHCPHCAARLGSFNWSGISNPQGAWVTPAFLLHAAKVDTVLPRPLEAIANVRRPFIPASTSTAPSAPASTSAPASSSSAPTPAPAASTTASTTAPAPAAAPSLPAALGKAVRRLGLGTAGPGAEEEEAGEQLPEPSLEGPDGEDQAGPASSAATGKAGAGSATTGAGAGSEGPAATSGRSLDSEPGAAGVGPSAACSVPSSSAASSSTSAWFSHLILDCDGVMVDSEAASCEALRRAILEVTGFDIPHAFPDDYVEVFGMDVRSCVAHYQQKFGKSEWGDPADVAPRVQAAKEGHYKELTAGGIRAFDGAKRLLRRALDAGIVVGVASSGAPDKIARNLASSGLAPLVPPAHVASAAHVAAGKPAPDVYLAAMRAAGCSDPRRALVVEDAVNGLMAARAAGMYCVGITNQLPASALGPWAHVVVRHLDEVDVAGLVPPAEWRQAAPPSAS